MLFLCISLLFWVSKSNENKSLINSNIKKYIVCLALSEQFTFSITGNQVTTIACPKRKFWWKKGPKKNKDSVFQVHNIFNPCTTRIPRKDDCEFDIETYATSSDSTNIKYVQQQMFGKHSNSRTMGCVNCVGKNLEVANGQSQIHNNSVRLLAYNKTQEEDRFQSINDVSNYSNHIKYHPYIPYRTNIYRHGSRRSYYNRSYERRVPMRSQRFHRKLRAGGCADDLYSKPR